jgi:hypothetical protein
VQRLTWYFILAIFKNLNGTSAYVSPDEYFPGGRWILRKNVYINLHFYYVLYIIKDYIAGSPHIPTLSPGSPRKEKHKSEIIVSYTRYTPPGI